MCCMLLCNIIILLKFTLRVIGANAQKDDEIVRGRERERAREQKGGGGGRERKVEEMSDQENIFFPILNMKRRQTKSKLARL